MKRIISGKLYNTETAKSIGKMSYGQGYRDFHHFSEELFQKKTGEFFLYGEGGPASKYAEAISQSAGQNIWHGGEKIIPLTYEAARKWAEENLEVDEYEAAFGEVSEGDEKIVISLSLSEGAVAALKRKASQNGVTMSAYIENLLQ